MNPLNPARAVPFRDGAVAIPDRETFEALSYKGRNVPYHPLLQDLEFVKFYIIGGIRYWVAKDLWGLGLAPEAAKAVIGWGFPIEKVFAGWQVRRVAAFARFSKCPTCPPWAEDTRQSAPLGALPLGRGRRSIAYTVEAAF